MKITVLGSSHGVPSADRFCSCYLIETGDAKYIVDAGAPVFEALCRKGYVADDFNMIRALFTTHGHGDHVDGVLEFADLANWYYKGMSVKIFLTEEKLIEGFTSLIETQEGRPLDPRVQFRLWGGEGVGYEDENIKVTLLPNQHLKPYGRPSFSLLVECEGKKVIFSGDLSSKMWANDFPDCHGVELLFCELAHLGIEHIDAHLQSCEAKDVVFTHVWPLSKLDAVEAKKNDYNAKLSAGYDGMVIEL